MLRNRKGYTEKELAGIISVILMVLGFAVPRIWHWIRSGPPIGQSSYQQGVTVSGEDPQ